MHIKQRILPEKLPDLGNISPLLTRIYAARHISSVSELNTSLANLLSYQQLSGITKAVDLLVVALKMQQRVLIVGDFDADGATASAVAVLGLKSIGMQFVDFLVPNRFDYGYGLSPEVVTLALKRKPQLLITVDNGISSIEGVAAAKAAGLDVLVTDHHLAGPLLPEADAIVNPNQPGCLFPSKALAGVGVIFYVLLAFRARLRSLNWFSVNHQIEPNLAELLDLVALGTVADVVPLDSNNRILVQQGLARIRAGRLRPGLRAIIELSGRDLNRITATDLGFLVGPRLNAAGRLDEMSLGIDCLLNDDLQSSRLAAQELDSLNQERKIIEQDMRQEAAAQLKNLSISNLPFGLCLFNEAWHQGVIGILASRLKERYHRPVIAFARDGDNLLKGSARSIPGFHIRDALDEIAVKHPNIISKFGGHAMAAGLSLHKKNFDDFTALFDKQVCSYLKSSDLEGNLLTDGELSTNDYNLITAKDLNSASPWGQAFPEPAFHNTFKILQQRLLGNKHLKLIVLTECEQYQLDAIAFNVDTTVWPNPLVRKVSLVYKLDINYFRGKEQLQLLVQHLTAI
ncbi:UNVERIFIED_CONTAM: hypothetical protein GTU68_053353 [Idotea baltica]|nr:hypothetical protein [Idotea baltica]